MEPPPPVEYPILFTTPMVKGILEGRKFQTRRLSPAWDRVKPGDRLWVRETFAVSRVLDDKRLTPEMAHQGWPRWYAAGGEVWPRAREGGPGFVTRGRWRPSIHMPRWASRILLEATAPVRREHVQQISEEDARAEGVDWSAPEYLEGEGLEDREDPRIVGYPSPGSSFARDNFRRLWTKINGAESWEENPVVRVVSFKRVEVPRVQ